MQDKQDESKIEIINSKEKSEKLQILEHIRGQATKDVARVQNQLSRSASEALDTFKQYYSPGVTVIPFIPRKPAATREDVEEIIDRKIRSLKSNHPTELIYTRDKRLIRNIGKKEVEYKFLKDQKIVRVFEALLDLDSENGFVSTESLVRIGGYASATTLRKAVGDFNDGVKTKLKIKYRLLIGRPGFGYRINPKATIIKE